MSEQRDQFDAHYKLADFYMKVRNERRQHEWRISLGIWVGLAAGIVSVKNLPTIPIWLLILFLVVVFALHWVWVWSNYTRHERDAHRAYHHLKEAEKLYGPVLVQPPYPKYRGFFYFTTLFEFFATLLLCIAFFIAYYYR